MRSSPFNSCIVYSVFISSLCVSRCNGQPIDRDVTPSISPARNGTQKPQCGFSGDSDVLGIGIRVGYYTQALSVWFANYYVPSEAKALRSINLLFLVALFIGLVWLAHRPERAYAVEVYLLLRLLFATWYVGVIDRSRFSKKRLKKSYARVVIRECSLLGLLAYTIWLAWVGLDRLKETPCGTFVFFVTKINLYGGFRSAFKALSITALSFGIIKQSDTTAQLLLRWQSDSVQDPTYYSRLQQALLSEARRHRISALEILDAAIQTPLPQSPICDLNAGSAVSKDTTSVSVDSGKLQDIPTLDELVTADKYLDSIIAISVQDHSSWCYEIQCIHLKLFLPSLHSPADLRKRFVSLYECRPFRPSILIPLFRHIESLNRYSLYSYTFMIEAAIGSTLHKQITTRALIPALTLHKAQLPTHRPTLNVVYHAVASLLMCTELMLNIELSIRWNWIIGMGNMGATGQLIPAVIGVGGLARVLWVWWSGVEDGGDVDVGVDRDVKGCADIYQRLKKEQEDKSGAQGMRVVER